MKECSYTSFNYTGLYIVVLNECSITNFISKKIDESFKYKIIGIYIFWFIEIPDINARNTNIDI